MDTSFVVSPEEALLITEWFKASVEKNLSSGLLPLPSETCGRALLCLKLGKLENETADLRGIAHGLGTLDQSAFYQARARALEVARSWNERDPEWKLATSAAFLFGAPSPRSAAPPSQNALSWDAWYEKSAGYSRLTQLTYPQALSTARSILRHGQLTILSRALAVAATKIVTDEYPSPPQETADSTPVSQSKSEDVVLEKNASSHAHGAAYFDPREDPILCERLFHVAIEQWQRRSAPSVRVWLERSKGVYRFPRLRLEGPYEEVRESLRALAELARKASERTLESSQETTATPQTSRAGVLTDPRCPGPPEPSGRSPQVQQRSGGGLSTVLWGSPKPDVEENL